MDLWHIGELIDTTGSVDAGLRPVVIKGAVCPLFKEISFVFRGCAHRRVARLPGHVGKPLLEIDCFKRCLALRVRKYAGTLERIVVSPCGLLELEGAALTNTALIGVRKAAGI